MSLPAVDRPQRILSDEDAATLAQDARRLAAALAHAGGAPFPLAWATSAWATWDSGASRHDSYRGNRMVAELGRLGFLQRSSGRSIRMVVCPPGAARRATVPCFSELSESASDAGDLIAHALRMRPPAIVWEGAFRAVVAVAAACRDLDSSLLVAGELFDRAALWAREGLDDPVLAVSLSLDAVRLYQAETSEPSVQHARVLSTLSMSLLELGSWRKAESTAAQSVLACSRLAREAARDPQGPLTLDDVNEVLADALGCLGAAMDHQERHAESQHVFDRAVATAAQCATRGGDPRRLARLLSMSGAASLRGLRTPAEELVAAERALALSEDACALTAQDDWERQDARVLQVHALLVLGRETQVTAVLRNLLGPATHDRGLYSKSTRDLLDGLAAFTCQYDHPLLIEALEMREQVRSLLGQPCDDGEF